VRTNIPQLLMLPETMNDVFGTTTNPWNKGRCACAL
jgi:Asp-tRNA(Asn)/Glu-tRNA(Gln) amidotransferase A subunit family amidase